jgi:hypothetical protein
MGRQLLYKAGLVASALLSREVPARPITRCGRYKKEPYSRKSRGSFFLGTRSAADKKVAPSGWVQRRGQGSAQSSSGARSRECWMPVPLSSASLHRLPALQRVLPAGVLKPVDEVMLATFCQAWIARRDSAKIILAEIICRLPVHFSRDIPPPPARRPCRGARRVR